MATEEVKIFFKVEGLDGYITDLGDLQKAINKTTTDTKTLDKATDELDSTAKDTTKGGLSGMGNSLQGLPGPLGKVGGAIGKTSKATSMFDKVLKVLALNPIIIPITAIVLALTTLYKAFTSTKEGSEMMDSALAGLSAVFDVLRDRVLKIGGGLVKFFKGDFSGAITDLGDAVSGIGEEIVAEFTTAVKATMLLQDLDDAQRILNERRAESNLLLADAKLRADDETLSIGERKKALEEVLRVEEELLNEEIELEKQRLSAMMALADQSDSDAETLDNLSKQRQTIINLETASINRQQIASKKLKTLNNKAKKDAEDAKKAKEKEVEDELKREEAVFTFLRDLRNKGITDEKESALASFDIEKEKQLKKLEENKATQEQILEATRLFDEQRLVLAQGYDDKEAERKRVEKEKTDAEAKLARDTELADEKALKDAIAEADTQLMNLKMDNAQSAINFLKVLAGKNEKLANVLFAIEKGLAGANLVIKNLEEKASYDANPLWSALPDGGLAIKTTAKLGANLRLATGLATLAGTTIAKFKGGGGSGGGGGGGANAGATLNYQVGGQQAGGNVSGQFSGGAGGTGGATQTYVLAGDVSSQQQAEAQIQNLARL